MSTLLRTPLRLQIAGTDVTAADLLTRAADWAENWATNDSADNPDEIDRDVALARAALTQPMSNDGWVYLTPEQLDASLRVLDDAHEYAITNCYAELGDDDVERMLGSDTRLLFHWPEQD